jgi:hypothetical protein
MSAASENIKGYMRNEEFIPSVHSTIELGLMRMVIARDNIRDYMRDEEYITRVQSTIEYNSK